MKKKSPLIIVIISMIQLGLAFSYFLSANNGYSFKENLSGYGLIFSGIAFFVLGIALISDQNKNKTE